jgi:hypothetical protein
MDGGSINLHSTPTRMPHINVMSLLSGHGIHAVQLIMAFRGVLATLRNMGFETFVEVVCAPASDDDCDNHKYDCYDGEDGEGSSCGCIVLFP